MRGQRPPKAARSIHGAPILGKQGQSGIRMQQPCSGAIRIKHERYAIQCLRIQAVSPHDVQRQVDLERREAEGIVAIVAESEPDARDRKPQSPSYSTMPRRIRFSSIAGRRQAKRATRLVRFRLPCVTGITGLCDHRTRRPPCLPFILVVTANNPRAADWAGFTQTCSAYARGS
jgi:hypothetical protein